FTELKRDFPNRFGDDWWSSEASYRDWLRAISITEITSQRTSDSLIEARKIIDDRFDSKPLTLYSVSSANHAPRIFRDELIAFEYGTGLRSPRRNMTLCAVAAETCYGGGTIRGGQVDDLGTYLQRRSLTLDTLCLCAIPARACSMTVLVTGGAGYIGSHMVHALVDAGERVVVLDNLASGFDWAVAQGASLVIGDVGDQPHVAALIAEHRVDAI